MALNSESRTVSAGKNAISALMNKLCVLLLTFIGRKIFIRYIGIDYLGINGLFVNILTLLSMADLGLGTAMNVSLYRPIAENDINKLTALLNYFRQIYRMIAVAVTVIGFALIPFLQYIVNLEADIPYLYVYYAVFVMKNTVSYLCIYKASIVSADRKNYLINNVDIWVNLLRVCAQIISVILFGNYMLYILIDLLFVAVHNIMISRIADKHYPFLKERNVLSKEEKRIFFEDIHSAFLYKISGSLLSGTDNILISVIIGTTAVGLYSNYATVTGNLSAFVVILFTSLTASVGNLVATSNHEKRYETFKIMQMTAHWLSGYVTTCLLFLLQDFITLWVGEEMRMDSYVLGAVVIDMYYSICMRPVWTFREGTGMYRQIKYIMFLTAIVNIVLSVLLGIWYGVGGILAATSIAKICTCFLYEPCLLFKSFFDVKPIFYYLEYGGNLLCLIVCVILCHIFTRNIVGGSISGWIAKGGICTVIVNGFYFIRYYKSPEFMAIKNRVFGLFGK